MVVSAFAILYVISNPGNRSEADDAFWFADRVETKSWRALPSFRHFLYLPLMRLVHSAARVMFPAVRSYDVMVGSSIVLGIGSIALLIIIAHRRFGMTTAAAVLSGVGFGLSYGFWRYSMEAEVYALSAFTALVAVWFALARPAGARWTTIAVLAGALAFASNALNATLVLVAIPLYFFAVSGWREASRQLLLQSLACALALVGMVLFIQSDDGHAGGIPPIVDSPLELLASPINAVTDVVTTNALNRFPIYLNLAARAAPGSVLDEERFVGQSIPLVVAALSVVSLSGIAFLGIRAIFQARRLRKTGAISRLPPRGPLLLSTVWLVTFSLAVAILGAAPEGWVLVLVPLWLSIGVAVIDPLARLGRSRGIYALIVLLGLHNLAGVLVMAKPETDFNQLKAAWLIENATQSDHIVTLQGAVFARYLAYYSEADVTYVESDVELGEVPGLLQGLKDRPGRTFLTDDVFRDPEYFRSRGKDTSALFAELVAPLRQESREVARSPAGAVFELS